jgi:hypothetical protein
MRRAEGILMLELRAVKVADLMDMLEEFAATPLRLRAVAS